MSLMTTIAGQLPNTLVRRDFLRIGGWSALTAAFGRFGVAGANAADEARRSSRAKSCILIWLDGGPSHLDLFDPKPQAAVEVRGPFASIPTAIPGVSLSELLPRLARRMNDVSLIRSVTSPLGEHNFGTHYLLTGYKPSPALEYPTFGGVVAAERESSQVLPRFIAVPSFRVGGGRLSGHGFLPASAAPFSVGGDPGRPEFRVRDLDYYPGLDRERLERRKGYLQQLDRLARQVESAAIGNATRSGDETQSFAALNPEMEQAYRLATSTEAKLAFRLEDEPSHVRQAYGGRSVGQCCLLARRLVERQAPFVLVNHAGWDTHDDAYTRLKEGYTGAKIPVGLAPSLDQALDALLGDLIQRGLLDETLVLVMGEFGRTPKLNTQGGRDHWPRVFSVLAAGAGIPGGQVIGASDATGENPRERPITPSDLAATVYTLLGIDPAHTLHTNDGRPVRINADGTPIREWVS
ncbi:MAG: DUF1501 domain-containing protein, partial [Planctomycetales bacterium]|nr:DUF1501 domain-containing protein [Planctomycetales bacterium]